jgi:Leucine-rich repeat (LRR) protein
MTYLLTCLVILSLNFVEIMSECENITMIKYKVDDEEFEDTIITTLADWKGFKVNLQQNTVICNKIFNISHRQNIVSLTGSEVTHLETEFLKNQETVEGVTITSTKIQTIRKHTFHHLEVKYLILDNNQISIIEEEAFFNLPLLLAIQISTNRLSVLNSDCFKYLPRITTFIAHHNKIKSLKNSFFQIIKQNNGYVNLNYNELNVLKHFFAGLSVENTSITLGVNQIKELPVGIFDGYNFNSLDLSHNLITDISEEFLQSCVQIQVICFDENVFNGTTLKRLQSWSRRNNVRVKYFTNSLIRNGAAGKFLSVAVTAAVFGVVMLSINI